MHDDYLEKIDRYLGGEMGTEERSLFEAQIAADAKLSSLVNVYRVIESDMSEDQKFKEDEVLLRKTLHGLNNRYFINSGQGGLFSGENVEADAPGLKHTGSIHKKTTRELAKVHEVKPMSRSMRLAVAASIIGIISIGVLWYIEKPVSSSPVIANNAPDSLAKPGNSDTPGLKSNPPVNDIVGKDDKISIGKASQQLAILYKEHFKPDDAPADKEGPLESALDSYENKQYAEAITAAATADLTEVTRGDASDQQVTAFNKHYYTALSYMALNKVKYSIPALDSALAATPDHLSGTKAKWYLALAYLKIPDLKKAENLLRQISRGSGAPNYKASAQKLLKSLQSIQ